MSVIAFKIPKLEQESFKIQIDEGANMYNRLHEHQEIQLTYIEKGNGTLVADNYIGSFKEGDVFIIGSHQPHVFRNDDSFFKTKKTKATRAITLFFDQETFGTGFWLLPECKKVQQFFEKSQAGIQIGDISKELLITLLTSITKMEGVQKLITFLTIMDTLSNITDYTLLTQHHFTNRTKDFDQVRMRNILEYTFKHFDNGITIHQIADIANLTPEAFCNYFKLRTRKTYITFLNEIRVQKACQLLQSKEEGIAILAQQCGFNNLSNFNRIFKKVKNTTPLQYKQKMMVFSN